LARKKMAAAKKIHPGRALPSPTGKEGDIGKKFLDN
jgi:hypothetical protein